MFCALLLCCGCVCGCCFVLVCLCLCSGAGMRVGTFEGAMMTRMFSVMGMFCVYDQAKLVIVGVGVFGGAPMIVTEHLLPCLPTFMTTDKSPARLTYFCVLWMSVAMVVAPVYRELSSQYPRQ